MRHEYAPRAPYLHVLPLSHKLVIIRSKMSRKRSVEDFKVSELEECDGQATVHGMVTELSPLKRSKKDDSVRYFFGTMSDGKSSVRVISFEPSLRSAMDLSMSKNDPISVVLCEGRSGDKELLLNRSTKIESSPMKFGEVKKKDAIVLEMNDLGCVGGNQKVNVMVKAKQVEVPEKVTNKDGKVLKKQDCVIGDASGCGRVVVWEDDVGKMEEDKSYKLVDVSVRSG